MRNLAIVYAYKIDFIVKGLTCLDASWHFGFFHKRSRLTQKPNAEKKNY